MLLCCYYAALTVCWVNARVASKGDYSHLVISETSSKFLNGMKGLHQNNNNNNNNIYDSNPTMNIV